MKNTIIEIILGFLVCAIITVTGIAYERWLEKQRYYEYQRGLMDGASYYQHHGKYPSYWLWNMKYKYPDFNIDTIIIINQDSIKKEFDIWRRSVDSEFKRNVIETKNWRK